MKFFARPADKKTGREADFIPLTAEETRLLTEQKLWWQGYWYGVFQALAVLIVTALLAGLLIYFSLHAKSQALAFAGIAVFLSGLVTTPVMTHFGRKRYIRKKSRL